MVFSNYSSRNFIKLCVEVPVSKLGKRKALFTHARYAHACAHTHTHLITIISYHQPAPKAKLSSQKYRNEQKLPKSVTRAIAKSTHAHKLKTRTAKAKPHAHT